MIDLPPNINEVALQLAYRLFVYFLPYFLNVLLQLFIFYIVANLLHLLLRLD